MRRSPEQTRPEYRNLRVFAIDPMVSRSGDYQVVARIGYEPLVLYGTHGRDDAEHEAVSIRGRRLEVVDVDTSSGAPVYLKVLDLENAHVAMQQGVEPSEADPQFHQQMVYAVAARTLEAFDRALGRVVYFSGHRRLRLVPHAFRGGNAFYHPGLRAVLFGYFPASADSPGRNLPGQMIFTCLSHDIIAHEVTHAVVDRLRPYYRIASNRQVRAFHEAFADLVAIFQRLTFRELVQKALQDARGLVETPLLSELAFQFGEGLGRGGALRGALQERRTAAEVDEEHDLGAVLVAAVFEGFCNTYRRRTEDLRRIASGGTGELPQGALPPDLVARLTTECCRTAQSVLTMCIRAFDYLPPADVTFAAFLRALVTADWELNPLDEAGLRAAIIEACRRRSIFAADAGSLAVDALLLDSASEADWRPHQQVFSAWVDLAMQVLAVEQRTATRDDEADVTRRMARPGATPRAGATPRIVAPPVDEADLEDVKPARELRKQIGGWFKALSPADRERLGLLRTSQVGDPGILFQPSYRVASDGTLRFGLVVQLVEKQQVRVAGQQTEIPSGATLVIDVTGKVRFVIRATPASQRLDELRAVAAQALTDPMGWPAAVAPRDPFAVSFHGLHHGRRP